MTGIGQVGAGAVELIRARHSATHNERFSRASVRVSSGRLGTAKRQLKGDDSEIPCAAMKSSAEEGNRTLTRCAGSDLKQAVLTVLTSYLTPSE
jgi:hypothetical protein